MDRKQADVGYLDLGIILVKVDRDAVYAVTLVGGRVEPLAFEHVAEVTTTGLASDLDSLHAPAAVDVAIDGARNGVEEGGPSTARVELGRGLVQGRVAARAGVHAVLGIVLVVLACSSHLGALFAQNAELLRVELGAPLGVRHALGERLGSGLRRSSGAHLESGRDRRREGAERGGNRLYKGSSSTRKLRRQVAVRGEDGCSGNKGACAEESLAERRNGVKQAYGLMARSSKSHQSVCVQDGMKEDTG